MTYTVKYSDTHIFEATVTAPTGEMTGKEWEVVIIGPDADGLVVHEGREFIPSKNGRLYLADAIAKSAHKFEGIKVYDDHLTTEEFEARHGMRSPANEWLGTIVNVVWESATRQLKGIFKVVDSALAGKLKNAFEAGVLGSIGLSLDAYTAQNEVAVIDGVSWPVIEGFPKVNSVDLVGDPAAGGGFSRIIASQNKDKEMSEQDVNERLDGFESKLTAIADAIGALTAPQATEAEEVEEIEEVIEVEEVEEDDSQLDEIQAELQELRVDKAIEGAQLSVAGAKMVRAACAGRKVDAQAIEGFVKLAKEADASNDTTGRVSESHGSRGISVGMNEEDRMQAALLRLLMGNSKFNALRYSEDSNVVKARESIRGFEAWNKSGRERDSFRRLSEWAYTMLDGNPFSDNRAMEAVTTSSMSSLLKNALNVMIANDYSVRQEWWAPIVTQEDVDTIDQATLVRLHGVNSLGVVNEGAAYTELDWSDEEETASFVKKGNYIGITLEAMLSDKIGGIRSIPQRLANSWYNTKSKLAANVFTINTAAGPTLSDTGALFNATATTTAGGHANLLTTAFGTTTAAYEAARLAMRKQTDQALGTGERVGIKPRYILTPFDIEVAAQAVINSERVPGSENNEPNPVFRESEVIGVPHWTDANDWALVADPAMHPAIYDISVGGQRVPSLFEASSETGGAMFTNDELRFKVRMLTFRHSATDDCFPVSDFRPLHKNNVA